MSDVQALIHDPEIKPLLVEQTQYPDGRTIERPRTYLRYHQRVEHQREIEAMDRALADPAAIKSGAIREPGRMKQQNDRRRHLLHRQSPPVLSPSQRDKLAVLERKALEDIREGMVSQEELRHKPPGVVDRQRAWESAKKPAILAWKNARILLNPHSDAKDLCNLERFRPAVPTRNLYSDGQIPAQFALSPQAKANYDQIDWSSPDVQAELDRAVAEGKVRINYHAKPSQAKARGDGGKVYACDHAECNGMIFSGKPAKARWARHMKRSHGETPSEKTVVAVGGGAA